MSDEFKSYTRTYDTKIQLKYGCNPQQSNAFVSTIDNKPLPFELLNGSLGYINVLDAINSWYLVSEVSQCSLFSEGTIAVASFKHTSPAGVGVNYPELSTLQKQLCMVDTNVTVGPVATAYLKARYSDPKSSFGDFVAISGCVDEETANYIKREVSDGIIAKGYTDKALEILQKKKKGKYIILKATQDYDRNDNSLEYREIGNLVLVQNKNTFTMDKSCFDTIVTENKNISEQNMRDMALANITLKYTQSNSISFAIDGQVVGIGAGQQNRVDCVKLAGKKAQIWSMMNNKEVISKMSNLENLKRQEKINYIIGYIEELEKTKITKELCLASDAFFPFSDNINVANTFNVKHIIQPGGSMRDKDVIDTCNKYNMTMTFTSGRLFTH